MESSRAWVWTLESESRGCAPRILFSNQACPTSQQDEFTRPASNPIIQEEQLAPLFMTGFSLPSPTRCLHSQYNLLRKAPKMLRGDREIKTPADFPKLTLRLSQWDQETTSGNPISATRECRWFPTLPTGLMYVYPKQSQTQLNFELKVSTAFWQSLLT